MLPHETLSYYGIDRRSDYTSVNVNHKYAIKTIPPSYNYGLIPKQVLREVVALLQINSKYVIKLIDVVSDDGYFFLVFPSIRTTLHHLMGSEMDPKKIILQLVLGLGAIHQAGFIHLYLDPTHILVRPREGDALTQSSSTDSVYSLDDQSAFFRSLDLIDIVIRAEDYQILIADFSLSHPSSISLPDQDYYNRSYRAPETLLGGETTIKSDIWALGLIIAELLISTRRKERTILFETEDDYAHIKKLVKYFGTVGLEKYRRFPLTQRIRQTSNLNKLLQGYHLPEEEISFLHLLLNSDRHQRSTVSHLLRHPWINLSSRSISISSPRSGKRFIWEDEDFRLFLIDWIITLSRRLQVMITSLATTLSTFNRILEVASIDSDKIPIYLVISFYIATTYHETNPFEIEDIFHFASLDLPVKIAFNLNEIIDMTEDLMTKINYQFLDRTTFIYLPIASVYPPIYFGDEMTPSNRMMVELWLSSLMTSFHSQPASLVSQLIISLVNYGKNNPKAIDLIEEIENLPIKYKDYANVINSLENGFYLP